MSVICCQVTAEWVQNVTVLLLESTKGGIEAVQEVLPHTTAQQILEALYDQLKKEPTVVDVSFCILLSTNLHSSQEVHTKNMCMQVAPAAPETPVVVVGDTHGQLHDVCSM